MQTALLRRGAKEGKAITYNEKCEVRQVRLEVPPATAFSRVPNLYDLRHLFPNARSADAFDIFGYIRHLGRPDDAVALTHGSRRASADQERHRVGRYSSVIACLPAANACAAGAVGPSATD